VCRDVKLKQRDLIRVDKTDQNKLFFHPIEEAAQAMHQDPHMYYFSRHGCEEECLPQRPELPPEFFPTLPALPALQPLPEQRLEQLEQRTEFKKKGKQRKRKREEKKKIQQSQELPWNICLDLLHSSQRDPQVQHCRTNCAMWMQTLLQLFVSEAAQQPDIKGIDLLFIDLKDLENSQDFEMVLAEFDPFTNKITNRFFDMVPRLQAKLLVPEQNIFGLLWKKSAHEKQVVPQYKPTNPYFIKEWKVRTPNSDQAFHNIQDVATKVCHWLNQSALHAIDFRVELDPKSHVNQFMFHDIHFERERVKDAFSNHFTWRLGW
jgi:hypothetical protein